MIALAVFDDGDVRAEAPVHLRDLEADVAAADDDQVLGQHVEAIIEVLVSTGTAAIPGQAGNVRRGRRR